MNNPTDKHPLDRVREALDCARDLAEEIGDRPAFKQINTAATALTTYMAQPCAEWEWKPGESIYNPIFVAEKNIERLQKENKALRDAVRDLAAWSRADEKDAYASDYYWDAVNKHAAIIAECGGE